MMSDRNGIFYENPNEDEQSRAWRGCQNYATFMFSLIVLIIVLIVLYLIGYLK